MANDPSKYWCTEYWKGADKVTEEECSRCTLRGHCGCCCGLYEPVEGEEEK